MNMTHPTIREFAGKKAVLVSDNDVVRHGDIVIKPGGKNYRKAKACEVGSKPRMVTYRYATARGPIRV